MDIAKSCIATNLFHILYTNCVCAYLTVDFWSCVLKTLNDPSGNGFIENSKAPLADPQLSCTKFYRTAAQNEKLGFEAIDSVPDEKDEEGGAEASSTFFLIASNFDFSLTKSEINGFSSSKLCFVV